MRALSIKKIGLERVIPLGNPRLEKRIAILLVIIIILTAITYGYFVKQAIVNVVAREDVEEEISELSSKVSSLEVTYIELKNRISLDFASSLGYSEVKDVKFVSRNILGKTLTLNQN